MVDDIDVETIATVAEALIQYEVRFVPAATGQLARAEFNAVVQRSDESASQYHGRVRTLFIRAYPTQAADVETSHQAITAFATGLADIEISRYVFDHAPDTFTGAVAHALQKSATEAQLKLRSRKGISALASMNSMSSDKTPQVASTGGTSGTGRSCWHCGSAEHLRTDCPAYKSIPQHKKHSNGNPRNAQNAHSRRRQAGDSGRNGAGRQYPSRQGKARISEITPRGQDDAYDNEVRPGQSNAGYPSAPAAGN
jgi:hypothetical protein